MYVDCETMSCGSTDDTAPLSNQGMLEKENGSADV